MSSCYCIYSRPIGPTKLLTSFTPLLFSASSEQSHLKGTLSLCSNPFSDPSIVLVGGVFGYIWIGLKGTISSFSDPFSDPSTSTASIAGGLFGYIWIGLKGTISSFSDPGSTIELVGGELGYFWLCRYSS